MKLRDRELGPVVIPEKIDPRIRRFWKHWNVGADSRYQQTRVRGTARLTPWEQTEEKARYEEMRAALNPKEGGRYVPPGHYVKLSIRQPHTNAMGEDVDDWQVVMSDTPDEMNDHIDVLANARGRVLIHGLGLGCVLNCVEAIKTVTHIDVVESHPDVLAMIAPFHDESRVSFHLGSCTEYRWPRGTRWNYVWHDIWSTISDSNLIDDAKAEGGISYARLHRMFGRRCDRQGSWGFEMARGMRRVEALANAWAGRLTFSWNHLSSKDDRLNILCDLTAPPIMNGRDYRRSLEELERLAPEKGHGPIDRMRIMAAAEITTDTAYWLVLDRARRIALTSKRRSTHA